MKACNRFTVVYANKYGRRFVETLPALSAKEAVQKLQRDLKGTMYEPYEVIKVTEWVNKKGDVGNE